MLSRTADHLYWMARYTERAENTARLLDVNWQMQLLPRPREAAVASWRAMLRMSELTHSYDQQHSSTGAREVLDFMVREPGNASSITSALWQARENARAVRGSLTTEVWETANTTWLALQEQLKRERDRRDPSEFFDWVKFRSHVLRGVIIGTMQQDEALFFLRIGTFLERADNTARILDVKFLESEQQAPAASGLSSQDGPLAQPAQASQSAPVTGDFYHWAALLRSVSGFEIYRKVYRDVVSPERVAELLILRSDMPRSLLASLKELEANLLRVRNARSDETLRLLGQLRAQLEYTRIADILNTPARSKRMPAGNGEVITRGLHAFLTEFMERVGDLGGRISRDFLLPMQADGPAKA